MTTEKAKKAIRGRILKHFSQDSVQGDTGNILPSLEPTLLHARWQFQYIKVGYSIGTVNDLYGSLGILALYAAITKCAIERHPSKRQQRIVKITEVGLYMRDTYDFVGRQYLGHWTFGGLGLDPAGITKNKLDEIDDKLNEFADTINEMELFSTTLDFHIVENEYDIDWGEVKAFGNSDYQAHRARTSHRGDLLLFSDIKRIPVNIMMSI